jgi:hypothetical protein
MRNFSFLHSALLFLRRFFTSSSDAEKKLITKLEATIKATRRERRMKDSIGIHKRHGDDVYCRFFISFLLSWREGARKLNKTGESERSARGEREIEKKKFIYF